MGVVWKARQSSLNRLVALKMIRGDDLGSEGDVRLFRHEAEIIAKIAPGPARNWPRPSARTA
jgi:hypothetical protein